MNTPKLLRDNAEWPNENGTQITNEPSHSESTVAEDWKMVKDARSYFFIDLIAKK